MKYTRFEELPVWQAAIALAKGVYALTAAHRFRASLRDQLERAALSVSNNIAEGFERGTTQEVLTFLYIARGSAAEVRSMLCLLEVLPGADALQSQISNLKSRSESISRQLRAWAGSLQDSEIRGQRYLTEASREEAKRARSREAFMAQVDEIVTQGRKPKTNTSGS
jgi:four helix bundle protein